MLVNISLDSLRRNPIRCGIDAKVRRKNDFKQKFSSSYPKAGDLSTKGRGLEDEIEFKHKGHEAIQCPKLRVLCVLNGMMVQQESASFHADTSFSYKYSGANPISSFQSMVNGSSVKFLK